MATQNPKKPVSKTPARSGAKKKAKAAPKKQGMDSDTKTIISIVGGLGASVALIFGGLSLYNVINDAEKPKRASTVNIDAPPASKAAEAETATTLSKAQLEAFRAFEGVRSTFSPDQAYEPGEVIIAAPPAGFEDTIRPAGFHVMEHVNLGRLGLKIVRVSTPPGMSVPDALRKLAVLLPGVTMDANNQFEDSSAGTAQAGSNPRAMAGWEDLSATVELASFSVKSIAAWTSRTPRCAVKKSPIKPSPNPAANPVRPTTAPPSPRCWSAMWNGAACCPALSFTPPICSKSTKRVKKSAPPSA